VIDDPILPHDWHVVARATELGDEPKAVRLLDRELVLWRSDDSTREGPLVKHDCTGHKITQALTLPAQ